MFPRESLRSRRALRISRLLAVCAPLCALLSASLATAQSGETQLAAVQQTQPAGLNGLPGFWRLNTPAPAPLSWGISGNVGYGYTEDHPAAPGVHHQVLGRLSVSGRPLQWLTLSGSSRLRHDRHSGDALGEDEGTAIDSQLSFVAGDRLSSELSMGARLQARFTDAAGLGESLANPAVEAVWLTSFAPAHASIELLGMIGYRLDFTGNTVDAPSRYRTGDRLALGVSEFDAVPLALGGRYHWGEASAFLELGGDWLLGEGVPEPSQFPWRASLGVATPLSDLLLGTVVFDTSLSARHEATDTESLFAVEPRFRLIAGLSTSFSLEAIEVAPRPPSQTEPPPKLEPLLTSVLLVQVTSPEGDPISDASVQIEREGAKTDVPHANLETYRLPDVKRGTVQLYVSADRLLPVTREVELTEDKVVVPIQLQVAGSTGQIRGVVRSFSGKGLMTRIRIEPLGEKRVTSASGAFTIDVPPGRYEIVLEADGHLAQRRSVKVAADGVVVLNADLRRGLP